MSIFVFPCICYLSTGVSCAHRGTKHASILLLTSSLHAKVAEWRSAFRGPVLTVAYIFRKSFSVLSITCKLSSFVEKVGGSLKRVLSTFAIDLLVHVHFGTINTTSNGVHVAFLLLLFFLNACGTSNRSEHKRGETS